MTAPTQGRGRGRPRPTETLDRDARALALLEQQSRTRDELAAQLGCTSHLAYLALWRLIKSGKVRRVPNGEGGHTNRYELVR